MLHARKDYNRRIQDSENLIPENEPVFLLRAQDKYAPETLRFYAFLVHSSGNCDVGIVSNTLTHANSMQIWQKTKRCKEPDMEIEDGLYITKPI